MTVQYFSFGFVISKKKNNTNMFPDVIAHKVFKNKFLTNLEQNRDNEKCNCNYFLFCFLFKKYVHLLSVIP